VAPAVRDLNALVNEIGVAYQPQYQTIDKDVAFNEQSGTAATAGLQAQQQQAFSGIEQKAQNKGMFFSGFSPSEQANYTSTVYLPKLAELNQTIAQTRNALLGRKAELDTDIRNKAFATRESDLGALRTWEQQQAQRAWEAEQNRLKMEQERQLQAQQIAAQRASARSSASASKPSTAQFLGQAFSGYKPAYEGGTAYYTEREVVPALMANYGMNEAQAKQTAYQYRKRVFGEGYGR